ncbi:MAG TPA: XRE family transcriptional regulator, partial [Planctomycetaceae bacterium]|nr:XRE family transcriptional regulator [Planctomycetaceae bacterium]
MPSELEIGRLIGGLRVDRGLTQRKLAELAGTNHTYLSKIENGRLGTMPSAGLLVALADVLEVDRDWLLT